MYVLYEPRSGGKRMHGGYFSCSEIESKLAESVRFSSER